MSRQRSHGRRLGPNGECGVCGTPHTRTSALGLTAITCAAHKHKSNGGGPCLQYRPKDAANNWMCWCHGGKRRATRETQEAHMTDARARRLAAKWSVPVETTPTEAILGRVSAYAGHVKFYGEQVDALGPDAMVWGVTKETDDAVVVGNGGTAHLEPTTNKTREAKPATWLALYDEASDRLVRFAAEALRAGVEERMVRVAEEQGRQLAQVIRGILGELALTDEQTALVGEVVPRHLRLLAG